MYFKPFVAVLFTASAAATPIYPRQDYLSGLLQEFERHNLTSAAAVLNQTASTQTGQQIVSNLQNGNHTVLAPSNSAIDVVLPTLGNDTDTIATILSYHIINGSYPASSVAPARSHTIAPTLLTNSTYVNLGGSPQVQVLEQTPDGNGVVVRRTTGNATVTSSFTYQNLIVHVINTTLTPPGDLKAALSSSLVRRAPNGFIQLGGSLQKVGLLDQVNDGASTTVFAPVDDAFVAANSTISSLSNDQLSSVLRNHVINNNVIYSTQLNSTNATAASGVPLNFTFQDGVPYVNYNQTRARILRSDVATKNGVVHVIDAVLA